ncbi:MAG: exo-alpha-sialidase [Gammaproteobacteria bacterium]|nr:exo-alpha-sialidase [Gammaproteobacteria bacterium]MCP5459898.1 exo-alpha-sialidase [Gammaproteobacteria bacterium]
MRSGFAQFGAGGLSGAARTGGRWLVPLLFFVSLLSFIGSAAADEWQVNEGAFFAKRSPELLVTTTGDAFVGYYDDHNQIIFRPYQGRPTVLNADATPGRAAGLIMAAAGDHLYAAWREQRKKETRLLLRHSPDKGKTWDEAKVIDTSTGPLTRIRMTADDSGWVYIVWLGERAASDDSSPIVNEQSFVTHGDPHARTYHIYARRSIDHGATWDPTRRLTTGYTESIWPTLIQRGKQAYSFSWSERDGKKFILFTQTPDDGGWQTPAVIREVNDVLILKPYWIGDRLLVLWLNKADKVFSIQGAFSDDSGRQWTPFAVDGNGDLDIANLELASRGQEVFVTFSARTVQRTDPWQQTVYLTRSQDGGATWRKPEVLRHDPYPYTKALYPRIAASDQAVTVVWNDFRDIRGNLYGNLSKDAGNTWLSADLPLDTPGLHNNYLDPFAGAFAQVGEQYFLLAPRYRSDSFAGAVDLILHRFTLPPQAQGNEPQTHTDSGPLPLLRETANRLWQSLLQGDYRAVYPLLDPFCRANLREVDYLASTGRIVYRRFTIKDIKVFGNVARVHVDFAYEIPELVTKQGKFSRPLTHVSAVETWVYVLDRWYKEYRNELGDFAYTRY